MIHARHSTPPQAHAALVRNAGAVASLTLSELPREVCQHCGKLRPVYSTIPVHCAGQGIEQVPLCKKCTSEVGR
jgi:hypothetical protein